MICNTTRPSSNSREKEIDTLKTNNILISQKSLSKTHSGLILRNICKKNSTNNLENSRNKMRIIKRNITNDNIKPNKNLVNTKRTCRLLRELNYNKEEAKKNTKAPNNDANSYSKNQILKNEENIASKRIVNNKSIIRKKENNANFQHDINKMYF